MKQKILPLTILSSLLLVFISVLPLNAQERRAYDSSYRDSRSQALDDYYQDAGTVRRNYTQVNEYRDYRDNDPMNYRNGNTRVMRDADGDYYRVNRAATNRDFTFGNFFSNVISLDASDAEEVRLNVLREFEQDYDLRNSNIRVDAYTDNTVRLTGSVRSESVSDKAERAALNAKDVRDVVNLLSVGR